MQLPCKFLVFLGVVIIGGFGAYGIVGSTNGDKNVPSKKPHIVFIIADDMVSIK